MKFKTISATLLFHLLSGRKTSTLTAAKQLAIVYVPREIRRAIEDKFKITVKREIKEYEKFGIKINYIEYSMKKSEYPKDVINAMYEYIDKNLISPKQTNQSSYQQDTLL